MCIKFSFATTTDFGNDIFQSENIKCLSIDLHSPLKRYYLRNTIALTIYSDRDYGKNEYYDNAYTRTDDKFYA